MVLQVTGYGELGTGGYRRSMNQRGISLIEVLIAVVLLAGGLLGLAASLSSLAAMAWATRQQSRAALVIEARMEWLRAQAAAAAGCAGSGFQAGSRVLSRGVTESWGVTGSGRVKGIWVSYQARGPSGTVGDTVISSVWCR